MRIRDFTHTHVDSIDDLFKEKIKGKLEGAYDEIERNMFISCWYNSQYLPDNVQYVPHGLLHSHSLFEPAQVYAPVF